MELEGKVILVIDDDYLVHMITKTLFEDTGATLLSANSGLGGMKIIQETHVDVVVLDVNMPNMTGYEVLKKIKEHNPKIEVIMCTAQDNDTNQSFANGAIGYVNKRDLTFTLLDAVKVACKLNYLTNILK